MLRHSVFLGCWCPVFFFSFHPSTYMPEPEPRRCSYLILRVIPTVPADTRRKKPLACVEWPRGFRETKVLCNLAGYISLCMKVLLLKRNRGGKVADLYRTRTRFLTACWVHRPRQCLHAIEILYKNRVSSPHGPDGLPSSSNRQFAEACCDRPDAVLYRRPIINSQHEIEGIRFADRCISKASQSRIY